MVKVEEAYRVLKLNELSPALGAKKKIRRGRGIGSGLGKTGGRGVKGQTPFCLPFCGF